MACVAPVGAPRHGVQNYPGRRRPTAVPFSGRSEHSGRRLAPMPRPKLSKIQKKALKWGRKHPVSAPPAGGATFTSSNAYTWIPTAVSLETDNFDLASRLAGFVGRAATQETVNQLTNAVRLYTTNASATATYTPTYTLSNADATTDTTGVTLNVTSGNTIIVNSTFTGTITVPMSWADWNAEWVTPTSGWSLNTKCNDHQWRQWQSRGHGSDFLYDPNDRLGKERLRRERLVLQEAENQRLRMEREARAAEERRRWEAEAPERERRRLEAEQQQKAALSRSYALLFRHLTDEQKNMFESENRFLIIGQSGHIYEIRRGIMHNIFRLDEQGRAVEELCCYIPNVPEGDVLLGQMLHLMANEDEFRRGSNRWELRDMSQADRRLPLTGRERPSAVGRIDLPRATAPLPQLRPPLQLVQPAAQSRAA